MIIYHYHLHILFYNKYFVHPFVLLIEPWYLLIYTLQSIALDNMFQAIITPGNTNIHERTVYMCYMQHYTHIYSPMTNIELF